MYYVLHSTFLTPYLCYVNQSIKTETLKTKYMTRSTKLSQTILNGSKKIAFVLAMLLTIGVSSSFANPTDDSNGLIKASFKKDFRKAELIGLESGKTFTRLTFRMNNMILFAFYTDNGDLLAVTRNIQSTQLPIQLLLELKRGYADYWISDLFELNTDGSNTYYVTVENADSKTTLRSADMHNWEEYSKARK